MNPTTIERRKRKRLPLRCRVRLYREEGGAPVETQTLNLSSAGFYCHVTTPFAPGENLRCHLSLPQDTELTCDVNVVRVEVLAEGFGVACAANDFSVRLEDVAQPS
jgi:hypothetical protein